MKKYLIVPFLALLLLTLTGCATTPGTSPLEAISQEMDKHVEVLSRDWPGASGFLNGIGLDNFPQGIVSQIEEIDSWYIGDGEWKDWKEPDEPIKLNSWQRYYIATVRAGHSAEVVRAIIQQHAPGILNFPEVISSLAFLGLAL